MEIHIYPTRISGRPYLAWEIDHVGTRPLEGISSSLEGAFEAIIETLRQEERRQQNRNFQFRTEY